MLEKRGASRQDAGREPMDRRGFLKGAGVAAMSFSIVRSAAVAGTQTHSQVRLGLLGCGIAEVDRGSLRQTRRLSVRRRGGLLPGAGRRGRR